MKVRIIIVYILTFLIFPAVLFAEPKLLLFNFKGEGISQEEADVFSDLLRKQLFSVGGMQVFYKDYMEKMDIAFCVEKACEVKAVKRTGAEFWISGVVHRENQKVVVKAKVHNSSTGEAEKIKETFNYSCSPERALRALTTRIIIFLAKGNKQLTAVSMDYRKIPSGITISGGTFGGHMFILPPEVSVGYRHAFDPYSSITGGLNYIWFPGSGHALGAKVAYTAGIPLDWFYPYLGVYLSPGVAWGSISLNYEEVVRFILTVEGMLGFQFLIDKKFSFFVQARGGMHVFFPGLTSRFSGETHYVLPTWGIDLGITFRAW